MNKVMLIGIIEGDIVEKDLQSGKKVANFTVKTTETWRGKDGKTNVKHQWTPCTLWGAQTAQLAHARAGSMVSVEGALNTDSWDDKETGKKCYKTGVQCAKVQVLFSGQSAQQSAPRAQAAPPQQDFSSYNSQGGVFDGDGGVAPF